MVSGAVSRAAFCGSIGLDAFGDGVAVDAKGGSSAGDALAVSGEGFLNVKLFKFIDSFAQHDVTVEHGLDYRFKLGAYLHFLKGFPA